MAATAIAIGIAGLGVTGCGLDVPSQVQVKEDTTREDPAENVVPVNLDQSGLRLESSEPSERPGR